MLIDVEAIVMSRSFKNNSKTIIIERNSIEGKYIFWAQIIRTIQPFVDSFKIVSRRVIQIIAA